MYPRLPLPLRTPVCACLCLVVQLMVCSRAPSQAIDQFDMKKGLTVNGSIGTSAIAYAASGIQARRDPLDFYVNGNLNLGLFGYSLPFSFSYSNRATNYTQPFNSFRFNPSYKCVKAWFGTASMNFSDYTLAGHQFSGIGVEANPGNWEFAAMYGRLKKAVEPDSLRGEPSYKRTGYAFKAGYNSRSFSVKLTLFSGRDHERSIAYMPYEAQIVPLRNTAAGLALRKSFLKHFFADVEYSFSIISQIPTTLVYADTLDRQSDKASKYYDAMNFGLQLRYERVAPDYQSLGAYHITNDMQHISIVPSLRLAGGRLTLNGRLGLQNDNLNAAKASETRRMVSALNLAFAPSERWNITAAYSDFNTYTRHRIQPDPYIRDELDSLNFYQISRSFTGSAGYAFGGKENRQNLMLSLSYQQSGERRNEESTGSSGIYTGSLVYSCNIASKKIVLSGGLNGNSSQMSGVRSLFVGPSANLSKSWLKNQLRAAWGLTYSYNKSESETFLSLSSTMNNRWSLIFAPASQDEKKGKHNASLNLNYMQCFAASVQRSNYGELTTTLTYSYSF